MRTGRVLRLRKDSIDEYREAHKNVPKEVIRETKKLGIKNYTIFLAGDILFSYFESDCSPEELDYTEYFRNPVCRRWEEKMRRFQKPLNKNSSFSRNQELNPEETFHQENEAEGEHMLWAQMEEIWHLD